MYVGIDLHKKAMQVAVMDGEGRVLANERVENTREAMRGHFKRKMFAGARMALETSSVWYGPYKFLTGDLGLRVVVANPFMVRQIATSVKKTDANDAAALADLLRMNRLPLCHVPGPRVIAMRQLAKYRSGLVKSRTTMKNRIHGVTNQEGIRLPGTPFTKAYRKRLRELGDYRIDGYLAEVESLDARIGEADVRIYRAVKGDRNAELVRTIPGFGYTASLAVAAVIDDIRRFRDRHSLRSYAGLVPAVRNSAEKVQHGRITKRGSSMLRHVLVEGVFMHVMHAPDSDISLFYKRLKKRKGASKAAVAAAARMLDVIFQMLREERGFVPNYRSGNKSRMHNVGKPRRVNCGSPWRTDEDGSGKKGPE